MSDATIYVSIEGDTITETVKATSIDAKVYALVGAPDGGGTDAGALRKANNLSDLASASTARTNLGLGTLATQSGTFSGTHSGTSSGTNTGDQDLSGLLVKASNLSDLTNAATARTNLGLGSLATQSGTFSGTSSGTNTGDQTSVTGNAGTATALATPRAINGVNFDGTAAITVTAAAGTLTGATLASGVTASSLTTFGAGMVLGTPASGNLANCTFPTLNQDTTGYASALKSATTTVSVSAATAPTSGQVLTATSSTTATWQTPASPIPTSSVQLGIMASIYG